MGFSETRANKGSAPAPRQEGFHPSCTNPFEVALAIFSLHHSAIGRSTHAAGTAGAHLSYITRAKACDLVLGERMPLACAGRRGGPAREWMDAQESGDRKNGRIVDKVMLALPRELSPGQQAALVRAYAEEVTQGRAPWLVALHELDSPNPHCHLVIRDRDPKTGKRVAGLSEKGSTQLLREVWERQANAALAAAGKTAQIDGRSLAAQGLIDQVPTVHVGPEGTAIKRRGEQSHRVERNHVIAERNETGDPRRLSPEIQDVVATALVARDVGDKALYRAAMYLYEALVPQKLRERIIAWVNERRPAMIEWARQRGALGLSEVRERLRQRSSVSYEQYRQQEELIRDMGLSKSRTRGRGR